MSSIFFFKQKTAYDMRISDWSSDVCSSDLPVNSNNLHKIAYFLKLGSIQELYYQFATGKVEPRHLKGYIEAEKAVENKIPGKIENNNIDKLLRSVKKKADAALLIGEDLGKIDYKLATCCNPIPGDDVFGFVTVSEDRKSKSL